jgi:integrase
LREVVVFAVATGLRRGEICGLTWDRVYVERGLLMVATGGTLRSKGGKKRIVPLNSVALAILKSRAGQSPLPQVFHRGSHPIGDDFLGKSFKRAVRDAGLSDTLHFHSLRHTFASWLVQRGESIHAVSKILGHSSVVVTERFYAHLDPAQLHSTVEKLLPLAHFPSEIAALVMASRNSAHGSPSHLHRKD